MRTLVVAGCVLALACLAPSARALQSSTGASAGASNRTGGGATGRVDVQHRLREQTRCKHDCDCWYDLFPGVANYCLGMRYWKHDAWRSGLELLRLAAGWGNKKAQYTLGMIYFNGHHVGTDHARGIAWLTLANERGNDPQIDLVARSVMHLATAAEKQRAQQILKVLRPRYGDEVAAARAWHHLRNRLRFADSLQPKSACILEGGGRVRWSADLADDPHALCMASGAFRDKVATLATHYFKGLTGTVSVGSLEQVPAPAASSRR